MKDGTNRRTDQYGGSIENRARLALEVGEAVKAVWAPERIGYRLTPWFSLWSTSESDPAGTFTHLARRLGEMGIGFIELTEDPSGPMARPESAPRITSLVRAAFNGALIANGGYEASSAATILRDGGADLVSFGAPFLANPDLPERLQQAAALNRPDPSTFYRAERAATPTTQRFQNSRRPRPSPAAIN